jgi:predicted MFS family arabinose efflux permease
MALETGIILGGMGAGWILNLSAFSYHLVFGYCAIASVLALGFAITQHKKARFGGPL